MSGAHKQIVNHAPTPFEIYSVTDNTNLTSIGVVLDNDTKSFNVPLQPLYSPTQQFYVKPTFTDKYVAHTRVLVEICMRLFCSWEQSVTAIEWHAFVDKSSTEQMLHCPNTADGKKAFYIQACTQRIPALFENTRRETVHSYIYRVHLRPPIIFYNVLPIAIEVTQPQCMAVRLLAGETSALHHLGEHGLDDDNGVHLVIRAYGDGECTWQGDLRVSRCVWQTAGLRVCAVVQKNVRTVCLANVGGRRIVDWHKGAVDKYDIWRA
jgi:hypothetical protein